MSIIQHASNEWLPAALAQLKEANLPTEDIGATTELYILQEEQEITGTIAIEHDNTTALLRSLSTVAVKRGKGYGNKLVGFVEDIARQKGIQTIYLLTTTAAGFFVKIGYQIVSRSEVPVFIQQTSEFRSVCPASATVMKKELS